MVVGLVLIGVLSGALTSVVALLLGTSFWFALGLYTLVGCVAVMFLPVARMLVDRFAVVAPATADSAVWTPQDSPPLVEPAPQQPGPAAANSMRILAVDDDPFILELIPIISAKAGFSEVTAVASGEQALSLLTRSDVTFDCLLFDISMPGMNGIDLCRSVRQIPGYRETPIIMLTAVRDMQNMGDAYRAGATDYATKPFDIEQLGKRLRLTQETIHQQRKTDYPAKQVGDHDALRPAAIHRFELPELQGMESLVDYAALTSYLTRLPRRDVTAVQVFAVNVDRIEEIRTRSSPEEVAALLESLVAITAECLEASQIIMAYTKDATLIVAANSVEPLSAIKIESDIKIQLASDGFGRETQTDVSVGGPTVLQGSGAERAALVVKRVIAFAENRALDKKGGLTAGQFKR